MIVTKAPSKTGVVNLNMRDGILIGIDAGTSVIKSVAFTLEGRQLAVAALPNEYVNLPNGGVEQDMTRTWVDTAKSLRLLAEKVPRLADRAVAIGVTGQGDGTWLMDKDGAPVCPAWLWLDSRAASIAEEFMAHPSYADHYKRTGTGINACQQSTHLAWMKRHTPEIIARASSAHHCKDWLYYNLTGQRVTDPSEAIYTFGLYSNRKYEPDVLDAMGAGDLKRLLPPIVDGSIESSPLSKSAASLTGLKAGTPVSLGYLDVICCGVGGGLYDPKGRTGCTIVGSTGMHMRMRTSSDVKLNTEMSGYTMCFPAPDTVAQMQSNMASTLNIDWLLDLAIGILKDQGVTRERKDLLKGLDDKILAEPAGRVMFHPYISQAGERGPFLEPSARATFTGLEQGMGFDAMMRGVFEGLCFAARDCYEAMGGPPEEIRVTGGAARSGALRSMLASALKAPVRAVSREEAGAAGAVMMAAIQQKMYPDMAAATAAWVDPALGTCTMPDHSLSRMFDANYPHYRDMREKLRPIWRGLKEARSHA
jgi:erythritol kinase (D-erythritol 1-phosphate-forming)